MDVNENIEDNNEIISENYEQKHNNRVILYLGIGLVIMVVIAIVVNAKYSAETNISMYFAYFKLDISYDAPEYGPTDEESIEAIKNLSLWRVNWIYTIGSYYHPRNSGHKDIWNKYDLSEDEMKKIEKKVELALYEKCYTYYDKVDEISKAELEKIAEANKETLGMNKEDIPRLYGWLFFIRSFYHGESVEYMQLPIEGTTISDQFVFDYLMNIMGDYILANIKSDALRNTRDVTYANYITDTWAYKSLLEYKTVINYAVDKGMISKEDEKDYRDYYKDLDKKVREKYNDVKKKHDASNKPSSGNSSSGGSINGYHPSYNDDIYDAGDYDDGDDFADDWEDEFDDWDDAYDYWEEHH